MSIDYRFCNPVPFAKIKKLKIKGITVMPYEGSDPDEHVCLTDGKNYVHAFTGDGTDTALTRFMGNDPTAILDALERKFGEILSEFDEGFDQGNEDYPPEDAEPGVYVSDADARGQATITFVLEDEDLEASGKDVST